MTLYSINGQFPTNVLPNRIRLANGFTKTDSSTFTETDLAEAGIVVVDSPPSISYPQKLEWSGSEWVIRDPTEQETNNQRISIQADCINKLAETDYKVIKAVELGVAIAPEIIAYRQSLRDLFNSVDAIDPWFVIWPVLEVNSSSS
jgi:hypothetical protein